MKIKFTKEYQLNDKSDLETKKINRRRWDRWLYLTILIILVISFIRWLLTPIFFDFAHGILLQEKYDVQFTDDVQILEYCVSEDQLVQVGDTLFSYEKFSQNSNYNQVKIDSVQLLLTYNNNKTDLIALDAQIQKRALFLKALYSRLSFWKSEKDKKEKLVYLNVITSNELANVDRSIDDVKYEIATTKAEYQTLINERNKIEKSISKSNQLNLVSQQFTQEKKYFISPVDGEIDRIIIPENQIYYKPSKVFSIIKPNFFVRAYIEMTDLDQFEIGDDVIIELPYGRKKLSGIVNKMYAVSEEKDEIINKKAITDYKHGIVVEIIPSNKEGWNNLKLSNIPVKIRKGKINL